MAHILEFFSHVIEFPHMAQCWHRHKQNLFAMATQREGQTHGDQYTQHGGTAQKWKDHEYIMESHQFYLT